MDFECLLKAVMTLETTPVSNNIRMFYFSCIFFNVLPADSNFFFVKSTVKYDVILCWCGKLSIQAPRSASMRKVNHLEVIHHFNQFIFSYSFCDKALARAAWRKRYGLDSALRTSFRPCNGFMILREPTSIHQSCCICIIVVEFSSSVHFTFRGYRWAQPAQLALVLTAQRGSGCQWHASAHAL